MFSNAYQQIHQEQDEQLEQMTEIATRIRIQARNISNEISNQKQLIGELDRDTDLTRNKLGFVGQKLAQLLDTRDMSQVCTVIVLFIITILLLIVIIFI